MRLRPALALLCLSMLAPRAPARAEEAAFAHPLFHAMQTEMRRSLARLKFEDFKPPYFLSYQVQESSDSTFQARYGARVQDQAYRSRHLYVELRTGGYDFDNSDDNYRGSSDSAALDDSEDDLRHRLWLLTDQAYKQAIKDYLQKRGKKVSEVEKEKLADFSREEPQKAAFPLAPAAALDPYKSTLLEASARFKQYKEIIDSGVNLRRIQKTTYIVNSEGSRILTPGAGHPYFLYVWARAQTDDGMSLDVTRTFSVPELERLPDAEALRAAVEEMAEKLIRLRQAKLADPYNGPAILDPESTGVLFHEAVGHRLEGERQRDEEEGQTFKGQIGKPIIPTFLSVIDDPTAWEAHGRSLNGSYRLDDEGVPAQKVALVEKGVLRNYLLSRRPISGFDRSNGHGRAQFGRDPIGRMSNLFVKSDKENTYAELKAMLLEECKRQNKPYGLLIRRTRSGDTFTGRGRYQAFRGTPEEVFLVDAQTGEETPVRGVEIVGTPLITINKIIATGGGNEVLNAYCSAESGTIPISAVAPWTLVKEIELQRVREDKQRPPILPPPLYDRN